MKKGWQAFIRHMVLFVADVMAVIFMYLLSWNALHYQLNLSGEYLIQQCLLFLGILSVFLFAFRCYDSLWRYADSREYLIQFLAVGCSGTTYYFVDRLWLPDVMHYSGRFTVTMGLLSLVCMWLMRFAWRYYRTIRSAHEYRHRDSKPLVVVGAGDAGVDLVEEIKRNRNVPYHVYGYFDDDPVKLGMSVRGVPVLGTTAEMPEKLKDTDVKDIVVAIPSISDEDQRRVLDLCSRTGCRVQLLPRVAIWMESESGQLWNAVREVRVEDLLGRDTVTFDNQEVYDFLQDKVVMVTGGGGSIGSELCRQIAVHKPSRLVIVDIYENNAYDLQQELLYQFKDELNLSVEIATVRDYAKMDYLFRKYHPQIVFHAAAHKHVPLMENCPEEAIKNNVFGTYNVVQLAHLHHAEKFILISTDKAVNPTNVMGASKRMCEMVLQSMQDISETTYVAVRFGNVLGSNGSVVPLFKRQLEKGGPLTVTDRRIIRYFMTIPEAAQLVMQAGAMADSSQIFVLDMGEPVKILTLAENIVRLSGRTPYVDIDIIETGLRPGEKLYEELLVDKEKLVATKNHKIFVEQRDSLSYADIKESIARLQEVLELEDPQKTVALMREIVPTFRPAEEVNSAAEEVLTSFDCDKKPL